MPTRRHREQRAFVFSGVRRRIGHAAVVMAGLAIAGPGCGGGDTTSLSEPRGSTQLVILHTNDLHSHLMGHSPERDYTPHIAGEDATRGGIARLSTAISTARRRAAASGKEVLLLDAGDFMMGTLFELLATRQPAELTLMQALGYDATTLGNHELDWTPAGLAAVLQAARQNQITLPILSSNLQFSEASGDTGDDALASLVEQTGAIQPKLVKTIGNIKVGLFGLLGENAVQVTPQARPLRFEPIAAAAARMTAELREVDGVDLVIALSHSGINRRGEGEDAALAEAVPGIDVIVSGHTHEALPEPVRIADTWIVTAGSYGEYLGELELTVTPAARSGRRARVRVGGYELRSIDDSLPGDSFVQVGVERLIDGLDAAALRPQGLAYRKVVAETGVDLTLPAREEAPIGNLVTDAYRSVVSALEPTDPPAIAVDANGQLRAPLLAGETGAIWLADLFRVLPIGIGPDQVPGYPLVSFYLNARDIRSGLELGAAPELAGDDVFLQVSGVSVEYDMSRPPLERVSRLTLIAESGARDLPLTGTSECYRVVTTSYVSGLLGLVSSLTEGRLATEAKDADCTTLVDPTTRFVDADPTASGVQELKHWQALLRFVSSFPDGDRDGTPDVPSAYGAPWDRIVAR